MDFFAAIIHGLLEISDTPKQNPDLPRDLAKGADVAYERHHSEGLATARAVLRGRPPSRPGRAASFTRRRPRYKAG